MLGKTLAVSAGFFAALASVCGKLAMAQEATSRLCETLMGAVDWQTQVLSCSSVSCSFHLRFERCRFKRGRLYDSAK